MIFHPYFPKLSKWPYHVLIPGNGECLLAHSAPLLYRFAFASVSRFRFQSHRLQILQMMDDAENERSQTDRCREDVARRVGRSLEAQLHHLLKMKHIIVTLKVFVRILLSKKCLFFSTLKCE